MQKICVLFMPNMQELDMVSCFMVAVIDLGHHVNSYDSPSAVIPQRTDGLTIKITEVTPGNQPKFN
jgi:hypothetical protein